MFMKLIYIIGLLCVMYISVKVSNIVLEKVKINRWIYAISAAVIIFIPVCFLEKINSLFLNILIVFFSILCVLFFESTRRIYENINKKRR